MRKVLVLCIIVLFLGVSVQPSMGTDIPDKIEVEPKDYLFQTIIDIANNPDVKELFEQYNYNIFTSDYKGKDLLLQLLFKKPRFFFDMFFTKPSITHEYLNKCYNNGIEITNILGIEKVLELIESIDINNPEFFIELDNIIINDEDLSNRNNKLIEINEQFDPYPAFKFRPIICAILAMILTPIASLIIFLEFLYILPVWYLFEPFTDIIYWILYQIATPLAYIGYQFKCWKL